MLAFFAAFSSGTAALVTRHVPFTLMSNTRSQPASGI